MLVFLREAETWPDTETLVGAAGFFLFFNYSFQDQSSIKQLYPC